jgi:hypothetical protein
VHTINADEQNVLNPALVPITIMILGNGCHGKQGSKDRNSGEKFAHVTS